MTKTMSPEDHLRARIESQRLEIERLRGLKPELPPRAPDGEGLPRYGLRWNGPHEPVTVPMDDGFWTPWHLAAKAPAHEPGCGDNPVEGYSQAYADQMRTALLNIGMPVYLNLKPAYVDPDNVKAICDGLNERIRMAQEALLPPVKSSVQQLSAASPSTTNTLLERASVAGAGGHCIHRDGCTEPEYKRGLCKPHYLETVA